MDSTKVQIPIIEHNNKKFFSWRIVAQGKMPIQYLFTEFPARWLAGGQAILGVIRDERFIDFGKLVVISESYEETTVGRKMPLLDANCKTVYVRDVGFEGFKLIVWKGSVPTSNKPLFCIRAESLMIGDCIEIVSPSYPINGYATLAKRIDVTIFEMVTEKTKSP